MRRKTTYLLVAVLAVLSCRREGFDTPVRENILFSAVDGTSTKAFLDNTTLKSQNNTLHVVDYLTDFTGTASWMGADGHYINDEIVYPGSGNVWNYVSGRAYPWTVNGSHHFFSWLTTDATVNPSVTAASFCNPTYTPATQTLSIPQLEMTPSTSPQFDFMYSTVTTIDAAARTVNTPVELQMQHLFTALNITLINTSGNKILLKSVTLNGLKNKRSANIAFTAATPVVTTGNITSTSISLYSSSDPDGDEYIHEDRVKELTPFFFMWSQTYAELSGAQIVVVYRVVDSNDVASDDLTATIVLDKQSIFKTNSVGMDAGKKYSFMLQFKKSTLDIYTRAIPWDYEEYDWDYSDHSISARGSGVFKDGVLAFYRLNQETGEYTVEPTTDEWSAKTMRFTTRQETLAGKFYIEAPTSGRWQISAYPPSAAQYFNISPTSGDIDVHTDNGKAEFTVSVNTNLTPTSTQTLYFNVAIYFNGEWHDANSEFNRKNIKLVLDAN